MLKYYYEFQQETLSSLSSFHQLRRHKNICISSITLATRYAIKGGLPSGIAYKIYDLHIQRTENLKDKESVWDLLKMLLYLCRPCKGTKTQQHSQTIAICKNYIFKTFTIQYLLNNLLNLQM